VQPLLLLLLLLLLCDSSKSLRLRHVLLNVST
jgi:hypothetical protein